MRVAIVGATGVVGETIERVLAERQVSATPDRFASRARDGVQQASSESLRAYDVVFFAGGEDASEAYVRGIVERGGVVIDNSSTYRMHENVPLVVPEINADAVHAEHRLFPVANCTAIILCMALAPIRDRAGLKAVRVASYQAASGAGRAGLDELQRAETALATGTHEARPEVFPTSLARNVIPLIGSLNDDGYSGEERKIADETRKILGLPELHVSATTVRVPVHTAHAEAVWVETQSETTVDALSEAFERAAGVVFHRDGIVTPRDVEGTDLVHVARLRAESPNDGHRFALWCVGDQLRKGAATNAVAILELLLRRGLVQR